MVGRGRRLSERFWKTEKRGPVHLRVLSTRLNIMVQSPARHFLSGVWTKVKSRSRAEYRITAWLIDRFVIRTQLDPTPSQPAPYYVTQFEKIPGTMYGYGLPDLLDDIQTVANASYRALVNNMGMASGPQVVINDKVLAPGENDEMYPWKRWHVNFDPSDGEFRCRTRLSSISRIRALRRFRGLLPT